MDAVLSLLPEARLAAVAVARIASPERYPIRSASDLSAAIDSGGGADGDDQNAKPTLLADYLVPDDFPIEGPIDLARVVLSSLRRCRRHQRLRDSLAAFERELHGKES